MLQDYSALRVRLFNSLDPLEGTNLLLYYAINKTTLVNNSFNMADVYHSINSKNGTRRKRERRRCWLEYKDWNYQPHHCVHRKILLQQPLFLPTPPAPFHQFPQPEDTSGQAKRRATAGDGTQMGARVTCKIIPSASQPSLSACNDQVPYSRLFS